MRGPQRWLVEVITQPEDNNVDILGQTISEALETELDISIETVMGHVLAVTVVKAERVGRMTS